MKYMYTDGRIHSVERNNASTMMQAFNYGTAAFEGMKAFWHKKEKNWFIFRPDEHFARISRSAEWLDIDFKLSESEFVEAIAKVIRRNNVRQDVYIRPLLYRSQKGVGLAKKSEGGFSIFLGASPHNTCFHFSRSKRQEGTASRWVFSNRPRAIFRKLRS
jgi:branched-chain amino acid aminotransferase